MKARIATGEMVFRPDTRDIMPLNYATDRTVEISNQLHINVMILQPENSPVEFCLITVDSIWISDALADEIRKSLAFSLSIKSEGVSIVASHSHSTPNNDDRFKFNFCGNEYLKCLKDSIVNLALQTHLMPREFVTIRAFVAKTEGVSINRRRLALIPKLFWPSLRVQNLPNRNKKINNFIVSVHFYTKKQTLRAMIFNFACHPVCDPKSYFGSDFPGVLRNELKKQYEGDFSFHFIQGFCGDIRPALFIEPKTLKDHVLQLFIGMRFRPSRVGDTDEIAKKILNCFATKEEIELNEDDRPVAYAKQKKIPILLEGEFASNRDLDFTRWVFGKINFTFLSAEVLSNFSLQEKCFNKNVVEIEAGYSNGMLGYLPTKDDFFGGGYEIDASRNKFALPFRISRSCSAKIQKMLSQIIE
ncbi:hypothetical protein OAP53_00065 [Alphaproteobacteria bacterium]|nr:hypothetical protein [Alphaproteobacteria bacterium]